MMKMRRTTHKPKRLRQSKDISRKITAQTLNWLLEYPIFPLSGMESRSPFICRLKKIRFESFEMQQGFISYMKNLVNCKQLPMDLLYSRLHKMYDRRDAHDMKYYHSAEPSKPAGLITFAKLKTITPRNLGVWDALILLLKKGDPILIAALFNSGFINKLSDSQVQTLPDLSNMQILALTKFVRKKINLDKERLHLAFDLISHPEVVFKTPLQLAGIVSDFLQKGYPLIKEKLHDYSEHNYFGYSLQMKKAWMDAWRVHAYKGQTKDQVSNINLGYLLELKSMPFTTILRNLPAYMWFHLDFFKSRKTLLLHIAKGKNIRQHPAFSFMTKKMAHLFHTIPPHQCRPNQMVSYCMARSVGCSHQLALNLSNYLPQGIPQEQNIDAFKRWHEPLKKINEWFANREAYNSLSTIMGYIGHCLRELQEWSIAGRTYESTIRRANEWIAQNRNHLSGGLHFWEGAAYQKWERSDGPTSYTIVQLKSSDELQFESQHMSHCVRSYVGKCMQGNCSIWSLRRKKEESKWESLVTIEVSSEHVIVQQKAKFNQNPESYYLERIREWAEREDLSIRG